MKLWRWFGIKTREGVEPDTGEIQKLESKIEEAEKKLADTVAQLPELNKAVASARRVRYKVDNFTKAMRDDARGVNHG